MRAVIMIGALAAGTGAAHAQDTLAERTAAAAEVPWYERFTYSAGAEPAPNWSALNPRAPGSVGVGARWGLSVTAGETDPARDAATVRPTDQAGIGAFYRFTPNLRVGGRVSVTEQDRPIVRSPSANPGPADEAAAGVRLESAFRF